ncbi:F-box/FBD/LRR-repeat protein, partial [Trifolium pratense]
MSRPHQDRLSSLPDEILEHILSYLPTKDAVATSFLTKRWKSQSLWRSQLNLHFNDIHFPDASAFRQFFYSVIDKRDNTLPILSFQLNCRRHGFLYETDLYNAVYAATSQGVENLSIDLFHNPINIMSLPTFVLTTKTLSVLKLKRVKLIMMKYYLPSLKLLHLESVSSYEHINKLLSGCPILQDFEAKDLIVSNLSSSGSDVLSLSNLVRANVSGSPDIKLHWFHNVHHLRIQA